jgi:hypothetical protein
MMKGKAYDLPDVNGHLTVSTWLCRVCAGVQEQIRVNPMLGTGERRLLIYAVRSFEC